MQRINSYAFPHITPIEIGMFHVVITGYAFEDDIVLFNALQYVPQYRRVKSV